MKDLKVKIPGKVAIAALALSLSGEALSADTPPQAPLPKIEAATTIRGRTEGTAAPGSRIKLALDQPAKAGSRYYWVQTDGPTVALEGQTSPELKLTVPVGADSLGFLLVVSDESGIKTANFTVPIVDRPTEAGPLSTLTAEIPAGPKADAGDDAIGLVGRRVTLNGSESRPKEGVSYRWIQVDGPQIVGLEEAGRFCSFVPAASGNYRFALVIAHENRISPADFVSVSVGTPPGASTGLMPMPMSAGLGGQAIAPAMMPGSTAPAASTPLDAAVAQALASLDDASLVAGPLAEVFQAASLRMDLYRTYGEIFSELSRRLDTVVPADPVRRGRWNTLLFEPMTAQTVAVMLPLGLDLRVPGNQDAPLTNPQKQELRTLFDRLAKRLAPSRTSR